MTQRKARAKSPSKVGQGPSPNKKHPAAITSRPSCLNRGPRAAPAMVHQETGKIQDARKAYLTDIAKRKSNQFGTTQRRKQKRLRKSCPRNIDIKDDYAKDALQTAVEIMRTPGETRERLWQRPDWCSTFRQSTRCQSEVTIGKAEEFLASLLTEEDDGPEAQTGS